MTLLGLLLLCAAAQFALALAAAVLRRRPVANALVYGGSLALSLCLFAGALVQLFGRAPESLSLPLALPWIGAHFRLDSLAACFLAIVGLGAAGASLYGLGYGRHAEAPGRVLPFYAAFLGAMSLVVLADEAFTFLFSWELMSLASWALVISDHRREDNRRAGFVYLLMASFGTLMLLLAFGLLAGPEGGYAFTTIRGGERPDWLLTLVLLLTLLGTGSKAGLVPLHVWLPLAHPAAPSHVSALMSGVMTKIALYGFVRIVFDLLGSPAWWWSILVLIVGSATAVLGVLYTLVQSDLKRVLAYSTIENIGIIFVAFGLALAFQAAAMPAAAALALTAALLHAFNHSLFKSLLFLGAGAVLSGSGERDLERLGGLIHRMPVTTVAFLIGSVAIAALPPLNGFVSEWLTLQSILLSPALPEWGLKVLVPAVGALLVLAAALAAACYVRAFGIAFLGRPRSPEAAGAQEVDRWSLSAMAFFALLCLFAGILPGFVIDALAPAVRSLVGAAMPPQSAVPWLSIVPIAEARSSYNGLLVFCFAIISTALAVLMIHRLASHALRRGAPWDCGYPDPSPATQYTASGFAQPLRRVFGQHVLLARDSVDMPAPGELRAAHFQQRAVDLAWERLYAPLARQVTKVADLLNGLQFLTIRRYLGFTFFSLVTLLLVLALWS
ncbi:MAG TPA: hydrogenase 4 subunit B [Kiloniellales bacterium]|nr:hydrogenase 4 subunit B [Kiloniellales bacterium]